MITRSAVLTNDGEDDIRVERLLSTSVDFYETGLKFTSFHGRWAYEMGKSESLCRAGKVVSEELAAGESGSRSKSLCYCQQP